MRLVSWAANICLNGYGTEGLDLGGTHLGIVPPNLATASMMWLTNCLPEDIQNGRPEDALYFGSPEIS